MRSMDRLKDYAESISLSKKSRIQFTNLPNYIYGAFNGLEMDEITAHKSFDLEF